MQPIKSDNVITQMIRRNLTIFVTLTPPESDLEAASRGASGDLPSPPRGRGLRRGGLTPDTKIVISNHFSQVYLQIVF